MAVESSKLQAASQWVLSLLPAGGAAYVYLQSHETVFAALSAVLLGVIGFTRKVWKELEDEAVKGTVQMLRAAPGKAAQIVARSYDWLWLKLTAWAPGYTNAYRRELVYRYGQFNDRGLGLINANRLNLERVYVDLSIDTDPALGRSLHDLLRRDFRDARPMWDFLNQVRPGATLAVTGPPGSGKTTLIQHLLLVHARNHQGRFRARSRVPFFVEIRRLPALVGDKPLAKWGRSNALAARPKDLPTLAQTLVKLLPEQYRDFDAPVLGWAERLLAQGRALLLFDGLDEVADEDVRRGLARWLEDELGPARARRCPAIVTSRPQGYRTAPLSRALVLAVQPFTRAQVERFIDRWYLANEIVSSGNQDTPEVQRRAREEGRKLLDRLQKMPQINDLTVNPLLLTMVCMVHRYHGSLPGSRAQLYREICQVLLERWRQARDVHDGLNAEQKLLVLRPLAAAMMAGKNKEIGRAKALAVMRPYLQQLDLSEVQREGFLERLQADSGLLLERESDRWSFAHLSFQEFLTAAHWKETGAPEFDQDHVTETWWREAVLLYAAQADATALVETALAVDSVASLGLALDLSREARNLAEAARARLTEVLDQALNDPRCPRFRVAAHALLLRNHQQAFTPLPSGAEIGPPVTQAEYQLFILAEARSDKNELEVIRCRRTPLHWPDEWFHESYDQLIRDVMYWQVDDYLKWLNQVFPDYAHRFPSPEELGTEGRQSNWWWCGQGVSVLTGGTAGDAVYRISHGRGISLSAVSALSLDLVRTRHFADDLARDLSLALARDLARDLARSFVRSFAYARIQDLALTRARDRDLARDLARDLDRDLDRDFLDRYLFNRNCDRDRDREKIGSALMHVKQALAQANNFLTTFEQWRYRILESILLYAQALEDASPYRWRSAARDWVIVCLEIILDDRSSRKWPDWRSWRFWRRDKKKLSREDIEALLGFLKELAARERGESEPKEVFCVVRERR